MSERNLNEMLNTEEISETVDAATLAVAGKALKTPKVAPVPVPVAAPAEAVAVETTVGGEVATGSFVSLNDFLVTHKDKIINAGITNLSGFSRVPAGKYLMFVSNVEQDAELILFEKPNTLWIEQGVVPETIKVESSGLVIKCANSRYYVGKNNISKVTTDTNNTIQNIKVYSRSKTSDSIRVSDETVTQNLADVDTIKLHCKKVSPRLYNAIKDMTTKETIKTGIQEFMSKVYDLNHLLKIEKELLYTLAL